MRPRASGGRCWRSCSKMRMRRAASTRGLSQRPPKSAAIGGLLRRAGRRERRVRVGEVGPERVVYGSNWPALYSDLAVEAIRRQRLGKDAEELVLGGNLARILGIS